LGFVKKGASDGKSGASTKRGGGEQTIRGKTRLGKSDTGKKCVSLTRKTEAAERLKPEIGGEGEGNT